MEKKFNLKKVYIAPIKNEDAKKIVKSFHYMKTYPSGALFSFGVFYKGDNACKGVLVFGKSSSTASKVRYFKEFNISDSNVIEMQRMWISDELGANTESKVLSLVMKKIKSRYSKIKIIWTYAGGCKNDCGIVYQSSGFIYLGSDECRDFYLTEKGEYKNLINILRFGKAKELGSIEKRAEHIYGKGEIIDSVRHYYFYPLEKSIRRKMTKNALAFPKNSARFRYNQEWVENGVNQGVV